MTLVLDDIAAGYGRIQVLRDVSITLGTGEIVALTGPSGAGKTTLLRAVTGMIPTMSGKIFLGGRSLTGASIEAIARSGVAYLPEDRKLFPALTVGDNLRLGGWRIKNTDFSVVVSLLPRLGNQLDQIVGTLSEDEQQLCAVGRALMGRPEYLLIDGLCSGISRTMAREIVGGLVRAAAGGTGVLLVEQEAGPVLDVASRVYVLRNGSIALSGHARMLAKDGRIRMPSCRQPEQAVAAASNC